MKYGAVIFDFFGTLVNSYAGPEYGIVLKKVSALLSVPHDDFLRLWSATSRERFTGVFPTIEANFAHICRELEVQITDTAIEQAARIRFLFAVRSMLLKPDSLEVVSSLKSKGIKLALISNCAPEAPVIWKDLPFAKLFDVTVFSCLVGLRKPDLLIYQLALEQLAVKPEDCLYIGDRADTDIAGATGIGMHPVLFRSSDAQTEEWNGPVVNSLKEILEMVK